MKTRVSYDVDPHNRLILKKSGKRMNLKKFRKIVRGRFKTDGKNRLYYEVFKSSGTDIPQKIKFSGTYSLGKKHNLIFTLNKWNNQYGGRSLKLRTKLISANGSEIVFLLGSNYTIKLRGSWQADSNNRFRFGVKIDANKTDILILSSAWKINKNNEIVYSHGRGSREITFKGRWDIKDRYRLRYVLEERINSGFDFRASLGRIIRRNQKTYVSFNVAIDIAKRKRVKRNIVFALKFKPGKGGKIILDVAPRKGTAALKLKKEFLNKKGLIYIEAFLREKERYFGGGAVFRW